jgi:ABC-type Fe3+-siderophore transport system permease subunit
MPARRNLNTPPFPPIIEAMWMALDPRLLLLITSTLGAIVGVYVLIMVPPGDTIGYLIPFFALMGIITANLVLLIIHEIAKKVTAKPSPQSPVNP